MISAVRNHLKLSLDDALQRIGIEPTEYRGLVREVDFTLKDFQKWLEDRERQEFDTTMGGLQGEFDQKHRRPKMFVWAMRRFGHWRQALVAAGVDLAKPDFGGHRYLSQDDVLSEIRQLQRAGADLSWRVVNLMPHAIAKPTIGNGQQKVDFKHSGTIGCWTI